MYNFLWNRDESFIPSIRFIKNYVLTLLETENYNQVYFKMQCDCDKIPKYTEKIN